MIKIKSHTGIKRDGYKLNAIADILAKYGTKQENREAEKQDLLQYGRSEVNDLEKELNENKGNLLAENIWQKLKYYHKGKTVKQVPRYGTIDALSLSESTGDFVFHIPIKKQ